tara:strand:- start:471 stop:770 length:300 start_codon:yes stop_codon:yes gene_type:complete
MRKIKQAIINFLSSKANLTIFQCLLYFVVGWVMGQHLTWIELSMMFIMMFGIQFITRIKAVSDGMMMRQMMIDMECDTNEFLQHMKDEVDKINKKDDWN